MDILEELNRYFNIQQYKNVGDFNGEFLSGRLDEIYTDDKAKVLVLLMFLKSLENSSCKKFDKI